MRCPTPRSGKEGATRETEGEARGRVVREGGVREGEREAGSEGGREGGRVRERERERGRRGNRRRK
jgi:hypothetical protein